MQTDTRYENDNLKSMVEMQEAEPSDDSDYCIPCKEIKDRERKSDDEESCNEKNCQYAIKFKEIIKQHFNKEKSNSCNAATCEHAKKFKELLESKFGRNPKNPKDQSDSEDCCFCDDEVPNKQMKELLKLRPSAIDKPKNLCLQMMPAINIQGGLVTQKALSLNIEPSECEIFHLKENISYLEISRQETKNASAEKHSETIKRIERELKILLDKPPIPPQEEPPQAPIIKNDHKNEDEWLDKEIFYENCHRDVSRASAPTMRDASKAPAPLPKAPVDFININTLLNFDSISSQQEEELQAPTPKSPPKRKDELPNKSSPKAKPKLEMKDKAFQVYLGSSSSTSSSDVVKAINSRPQLSSSSSDFKAPPTDSPDSEKGTETFINFMQNFAGTKANEQKEPEEQKLKSPRRRKPRSQSEERTESLAKTTMFSPITESDIDRYRIDSVWDANKTTKTKNEDNRESRSPTRKYYLDFPTATSGTVTGTTTNRDEGKKVLYTVDEKDEKEDDSTKMGESLSEGELKSTLSNVSVGEVYSRWRNNIAKTELAAQNLKVVKQRKRFNNWISYYVEEVDRCINDSSVSSNVN